MKFTFGISGSAQIAIVAVIGLLGIGLVALVWKRYDNPAYLAAASIILTLLLTPYALQYDNVPLTLAFLLTLKHLPDLKPLPRAAAILPLVLRYSSCSWRRCNTRPPGFCCSYPSRLPWQCWRKPPFLLKAASLAKHPVGATEDGGESLRSSERQYNPRS